MAAAMMHASLPPAAAKPLAREGVSLEALKQFDVSWAVGCLAERNVKLNPRELQQSCRGLRRRCTAMCR